MVYPANLNCYKAIHVCGKSFVERNNLNDQTLLKDSLHHVGRAQVMLSNAFVHSDRVVELVLKQRNGFIHKLLWLGIPTYTVIVDLILCWA